MTVRGFLRPYQTSHANLIILTEWPCAYRSFCFMRPIASDRIAQLLSSI